jgi:hypothetical protein
MVSPTHPDKSALHLLVEKDGQKIAENLFIHLPDKYIDWPKVEITTSISRITEKQWKLALKSNAIAKDVQIHSPAATRFSDNFVDLIPPDQVEITIDSKEPAASIEPELRLNSISSVFQSCRKHPRQRPGGP